MHLLLFLLAAVSAEGDPAMSQPAAAPGPNILFLSKSESYEHEMVKRDGDSLSVAEKVMEAVAARYGAPITLTKDADVLTPESLKKYTIVVFYTAGDLTKPTKDGGKPAGPGGMDAVVDWVKGGGAFVGIHPATATYMGTNGEITPYIQMIGGEFDKHGAQFVGGVKAEAPGHPAIKSLPASWRFMEEWYLHKRIFTDQVTVLARLEIGEERKKQEMYNIPDPPIIWCHPYEKGRVVYNGLGHRAEIWESPEFQALLLDHLNWVSGRTE